MATLTEDFHDGGFVVSEANGTRSREVVTLLAGQAYKAGTVLGKITASGKYTVYDPANLDGSETPAGVLRGAVDATAADAPGTALVRDAEVNAAELEWFAGATANQKATGQAGLATLGIIAR